MASETPKKKSWQPKRHDWKKGEGNEDGEKELREQRMAEVGALTAEGKVAQAKVKHD